MSHQFHTPARYDDEGSRIEETYRENCRKCGGRGRFIGWSGRDFGSCFACDSVGYKVFKTAPQDRAKARVATAKRKERNRQENVDCFAGSCPAEWAWINAAAERGFNFAVSLREAVEKYGELSERQLETARRLATQDAQRKAERQAEAAARVEAAPVVETSKLEAAFNSARASGLRRLKMRFCDFEIKPAKETSRNAGAYYVTSHGGGTYYGKLQDGRFVASRDCEPGIADGVQAAMVDPLASARYFGKFSGTCSCCGRELTDPASIEAGIGPVCAGKFGL